MYPDRAARKEIGTLKFHCHYVDIGCPWVGTLKQLEEHAAQCAYKGVNCPHSGCDVCTTATLLEEHVKECTYREISCKYCGTALPFRQLAVSNKPVNYSLSIILYQHPLLISGGGSGR